MNDVNLKEDARFVSRLTRNTLALILAGGQGSRLHELTTWRAKPGLHSAANIALSILRYRTALIRAYAVSAC